MYILLMMLFIVIFFKDVILPNWRETEAYSSRNHIVRERHHVATDYENGFLNTKEAFLRICSRNGIKIKHVHLSQDESVEQIVFKKGLLKADQVSISMPYTKEKFYLLSGYIMKSFDISKKIMIEDGKLMATSLFGFEFSEYAESIEWCNTSDLSAIRKALMEDLL